MDLQTELDRFSVSPESDGMSVSALFLPLEGSLLGTTQYHADRPVVPASVTKLVTSFVALSELGPDYTFSTRVSHAGTLGPDGILSGDLILEGSGDPFFVSERMWLLANQLRQSGLEQVEGNLVIAANGPVWADPTQTAANGGSDRAWAALPSVLAVNFNSLAVRITPGLNVGDPIQIVGDPFDLPYLRIENELTTGAAGTAPKWHLELETTPAGEALSSQLEGGSFHWTHPGEPLERARIHGRIPVGTQSFVAYRRVRFPLAHFAEMFRAALAQVGIEITGSIILTSDTGAHTLLAEFESPPLQDLLTSMNRYSNNFIANQLAIAVHQKVAANRDSIPDGPLLPQAGETLARWLIETIQATPAVTLEDGSGLSANNRLNADTLVKLLAAGWNDFSILPKLMFSLPGPRGIGTLKSRFGGAAPPPDLWAKTGTFQDERVCSLAGYFDSATGPVAFAILMDGELDSRWKVRRMQTLQEFWIDLYLK